jgi:hypothetical protein
MRQLVSGSDSSFFSRFFWRFFERWNQNLSTSAPSSASMRSKWLISSIERIRSFGLEVRNTRSMIGAVYHEPNRMPMRPRGGSTRQ